MEAFMQEIAVEEARLFTCQPMPLEWAKFASKYKFKWSQVHFHVDNAGKIPTAPGFYCFFIGVAPSSLPPIGYPLYVGKTERTLRLRFRDYVREKASGRGRVHIRRFLHAFDDELTFFYTPFKGTQKSVQKIERELHDALRPPFGQIGFSAAVGKRVKAFRR